MAERDGGRVAVRCPNRACPSRRSGPGRILFEHDRGVVFKQDGRASLMTLGLPISATCGSCGHHWLNPDVAVFDGVGALIERTIQAAASRVNSDLAGGDDDGHDDRRAAG